MTALASVQDVVQEAVREDAPLEVYVLILVGMALLPFMLTMITSFARIVIVGGILRQALGMPQIPPTSVLTGIALVLTLHVMSPVLDAIVRDVGAAPEPGVEPVARAVVEHVGAFLRDHIDPRDAALMAELQEARGVPGGGLPRLATGSDTWSAVYGLLTVDAPAFVLTELTKAFQIGFVILIVFLVVDLVVGNLLLALGMHMLNPVTVSLPLKILLFVQMDGWRVLLDGLVRSYGV